MGRPELDTVLLLPELFVTVALPGAAVTAPPVVRPFFPVAVPAAVIDALLTVAVPVALPPLDPVAVP